MGKESEIQHFGFSAEQVSIERIYLIKKILNSVFDCVLKKIECSRETSQLFAKQKDDVVQAVMNSIGDHIKTCESLDKKYFSVPDHVLLPPYFDHAKSYTNSDEKQIDEEIQIHRSTFLENSIMLASLKMENSQYKHFVPFLEEELHMQSLLKESFTSLNMKEINELVEKTISFGNE